MLQFITIICPNGSHSTQLGGLASQTQLTRAHSKSNNSSHINTHIYYLIIYLHFHMQLCTTTTDHHHTVQVARVYIYIYSPTASPHATLTSFVWLQVLEPIGSWPQVNMEFSVPVHWTFEEWTGCTLAGLLEAEKLTTSVNPS